MHVSEQVLEMAALGRPFQLGMLYDCRSDFLLPGITLWDPGTLAKNIDMRAQPNTETQVIAFDTLASKASALSLSPALSASFMGSLVRVGGSAKFLTDSQRSRRQARVTLKYSASTHFKQLTMSQVGQQHVSYPEVFEQSVATHVVTGILYGAHAFFVFDQMSASVEAVQDVQAKLHATVMKIPTAAVAGEGGITGQRGGQGKDVAGSFSCSFYGDFALESNPTTYAEALRVYASLPQRLGRDGEKAVPVKVWLYPLIRLNPRAARLVREVSAKLVSDTGRALEKLLEVDVRSNDLLQDPISMAFPEIPKKIRAFQHLCEQHKCAFQARLAQVLPSVRGGGAEEGALVDLLRENEQSPFRTSLLKKFLDLRYREIYFVKFFLDLSKGRVSSQDDLVKRVLDPRIDAVVAFTFTSLEAKEPYLHALRASLAHGSGAKPQAAAEAPKGFTPWFEDKDVLERARNAAMVFADFSLSCYPGEIRFVVTSRRDDGNPGAVLVRYQSGSLDGARLELLARPSPPLIGAVSFDSFELTFQPAGAGAGAVSGYYVQYRVFGQAEWMFAYVKGSEEKFLVAGLEPQTSYELRYAVEGRSGLSRFSELSEVVRTGLRSSPPGRPTWAQAASCFSFQVQLAWGSPDYVAEGVAIKEYKVQYRKRGEGWWWEHRTGGKVERWGLPRSATRSIAAVRVVAVYEDGWESEPSEEAVWSEL